MRGVAKTCGSACHAFITETVDCGDDFTYKQVGSNLSGRVSRGALGCGRSELTQDCGIAVRTPGLSGSPRHFEQDRHVPTQQQRRNPMGRLIVSAQMRMDCVMDQLEGWFDPEGVAGVHGLEQLRAADAVILGR